MDLPVSIIPFISVGLFAVVFYKSVMFFKNADKEHCSLIAKCPPVHKTKCREGDKAVVACIAAASLLFIIAQVLDWTVKGFNPEHGVELHIWHGYDFFSAVTWLLFVYHLRARLGWRNHP